MSIRLKKELLTGNKDIDEQHQELFDRVNDFYQACLGCKEKNEVVRLLHYLDDYVRYHLSYEEELMEKHNYGKILQHKAGHNIVRCILRDIKNSLKETGPTASFVVKVNKSMLNWLISHVGHEDKELTEFISQVREIQQV